MSLMNSVKQVFVPIHKEGHPFILIAAVVSIVLMILWSPLGWLGVVLTVWCVYFFRDPDRVTPLGQGLVISPADGRVVMVGPAPPPPELNMGEEPRMRIAIFMNVFDVHVNRAPADGEITAKAYTPGKFLNAELDKASEDNERMAYRLRTSDGKDIAFVQIAGLVARRIVSWTDEYEQVKAGQRIGMIRFGSRVDVYLDDGIAPVVAVGQTCLAGETVIADSSVDEIQRWGEIR